MGPSTKEVEPSGHRVVYVAHPSSGLGRSNFPIECHVVDNKIVRCLPIRVPESVRLYEIRTSRGTFTRPRKEVQMPLAYSWKRRIHCADRVAYPLLRADWSPDDPRPQSRGRSRFVRISWDQAVDIVVSQLKKIRDRYGSMESVLVQADGHGQSGYLQTLRFWGHYLFEQMHDRLGWGWWLQQMRNPDSWEGYYYGAKHVWGFEESLGEPWQDAVWDDVLENTEMVLFSGNDPEATGFGMSGSIATIMTRWLKQAGIKIVAISPDLNYAGAVCADKWIPLKPNTDAALYLAVAWVWIAEGLYDRDYVATHTVGFEQFKEHVLGRDDELPKTTQWAEKITGVPAHTITALAREWARRRTTLSVYFGGPKIRGTMSHLVGRLEAYVMAMQGIGKPGRQFLRVGAPSFDKKALAQVPRYPAVDKTGVPFNPVLEYAIGRAPKSPVFVPRTLVADAVLNPPVSWRGSTAALADSEDQFKAYQFPPAPDHPGIKMIWNENGNQVGSWTHGRRWIDALRHAGLEFIVGVHPWLENDQLFSDLILPAQTAFEHEDLIAVRRSEILALFYQERAIEPVGEARSDYEIHRLIAQALGIGSAFPPAQEWLKRDYEQTFAFRQLGVSWEEFKRRRFVIYDCPSWQEWVEIKKQHGYGEREGGLAWFWKAGQGLQTPSGKIEFVSQRILQHAPDDRERPPLAQWIEHAELSTSAKARRYPLLVVANHPRLRFHVQGDDIDWLREMWKIKGPDGFLYEPCRIHRSDAAARAIAPGDIVMVYNDRGKVLFAACLSERIIPGAVYTEHGARMDLIEVEGEIIDRGGDINLITPSPAEKYQPGERVRIPEMNVSGFLVEVEKVDIGKLLANARPHRAGAAPA